MSVTLSVSGTVLSDVKILKGAVYQFCFDVKPFNLTACLIMKINVTQNVKIKHIKMAGHGNQCMIMYDL